GASSASSASFAHDATNEGMASLKWSASQPGTSATLTRVRVKMSCGGAAPSTLQSSACATELAAARTRTKRMRRMVTREPGASFTPEVRAVYSMTVGFENT